MTTKILVVGPSKPTSVSTGVVYVASYDEAIELLQASEFDIVITAAKIAGNDKSAMDVLRHIKGTDGNKQHEVWVCHLKSSCLIEGKQSWNIRPSLQANFPFAKYYKGTVNGCLSKIVKTSRQCA